MVHSGLLLAATPAEVASRVSVGEAVAFWILGPIALVGALGMLFSRNAVHSALWLVLTMLSLGVFYIIEQAPFLGFVQIIVYTGAIMMLFLFVLMLAGRDSSDSVVEVLRGQRLWAGVLGVGLAGLVVGIVARGLTEVTSAGLSGPNSTGSGNVDSIGRLLFTDFLFPFELTSALLITAAIGAMVLAGRSDRTAKRTQRDLAIARFRGEHARPSPLPGPGVFATANSVATPALLPDGSVAPESLSAIIESASVDEFGEDVAEVSGREHQADAHALSAAAKPAADPAGRDDNEEARS
ncbi:MAG TPA: NADH-quinone oxidoreductase subunit J [Pseudonocardiaceae bacterium]|jgi:NADH-quinone oxidoreductase subunit J|nr:NADH-quinone oxidoreductase subunit J [Pseudonocardiaceae bacterium]